MISQNLKKWLSITAILGGLAGLLLGFGGRLFPPFDVFAHFTPHFLSVLVSGLIAYYFQSRAVTILTLGAILTLAIHPLISVFTSNERSTPKVALATGITGGLTGGTARGISGGKPPSQKSEEVAPLKIVSFNSWHSNTEHVKLVNFINKQKADLVVLLEFGPDKLKLLRKMRGQYPHITHCADHWFCSVAILSKHPVKAKGGAGPRTTMPAHIWVTVDAHGKDLTLVGTHLHRPVDGMNRHRRQLMGLSDFAKSKSGPVIVAGDFNTTKWADSFRLFQGQSGFNHMARYLPSWPAQFPQLAIDHIFYNDGVIIDHIATGPQIGSDHLPLFAYLRLKK